jgi:hypothetical protein
MWISFSRYRSKDDPLGDDPTSRRKAAAECRGRNCLPRRHRAAMTGVKSTDVATDAIVRQATQADRVLQKLDAEDMAFLSGLLQDGLRRIAPDAPQSALSAFAQLVMTLIAAAVRQAITLPTREARRLLALFKRMLPKTLAAMEKDVTA